MLGNIVRIAGKDLQLLWADKFGLFWILIFPLLMASLFGSIFAGSSGQSAMSVAIVDLDDSEASRRFVARLDASEALRAWRPTDRETGEPMAVTEALARDAVRRGAQSAFIVIPEGYGANGPFSGLGAELRVGIDPSRRAEAGYLQGLIMEATFTGLREVLTDRDTAIAQIDSLIADAEAWDGDGDPDQRAVVLEFFRDLRVFAEDFAPDAADQTPGTGNEPSTDDTAPRIAPSAGDPSGETARNADALPDNAEDATRDDDTATDESPDDAFSFVRLDLEEVVREGVGPRSAFEVSFPQAMIWALVGACTTFAITLVRERKEGTLLRLRVAPHPMSVVLAGKGLACFATCVSSLALLTAIAHVAFGMRIESYALYALGIICIGICFVGIMMAIATMGSTEEAVSGAGWGVLIVMSMLGGGMVPLIVMPQGLVTISRVSPVRWAVWSMEGAVWRGLTFEQMLPAYLMLIGIGAVTFTLGVWLFTRRAT